MEKPIKDFEDYIINDSGINEQTVWSTKTNKWLKPTIASNGYYVINLCKNGVPQTRTIHSLIGEAFIENIENKPCIDHINTIRTDNRVENLRWCTRPENQNNTTSKVKMSEAQKKRYENGDVPWNKGKHHTEEAKKRMSEAQKKRYENGDVPWNKGKQMPKEIVEKISKKVYQSTVDGELVKIWDSVNECGRNGYNFKSVSNCCLGKRKTHKGFKWSYQPLQ